ncbi:TIGR03564 family F420-dependent LLM class oxidoreductase [Amycolatopsis jejuensis]|uniref:TIGR03564 family F420-dependent LLM class oxidoreductase n=1 Tax=Amycolatopsis jejuensis TaxID=330084 RepID=UPI000526513B|nr:TIGR03564 family F420-dependent LLM class oxidoreductase [Amycolatopsis jejuensis]
MRIGTNLDSSGMAPLEDARAEAVKNAARGFDSGWTNQFPNGLDALALLPYFSDGPAELGTAVVPTYPRHPAAMATEALAVQAMTGGRLTLGIGPSHKVMIEGALGLAYSAPARHTREYLEVLKPLLRGEHVKYSGEFFTVDTQLSAPTPPPSVLVSALGPRMLEVTRELAEGTIAIWVRPDLVADYLVPRLGDGARVVVGLTVSVTADPDGTRERVARNFSMIGDLPAYRAVLDRGGLDSPADALVVGDEADVLRELARFRDAGTTDLIVHPEGTAEEKERTLEIVAGLER